MPTASPLAANLPHTLYMPAQELRAVSYVSSNEKKGRIEPEGQLAFAAAILTLLFAGGMSYRAIAIAGESDLFVRHTHLILQGLQNLIFGRETIRSSSREFALTGSESSLQSFRVSKWQIEQQEQTLRNLTSDNPAQQRLMPSLHRLGTENINLAGTGIARRRANIVVPAAEDADAAARESAASAYQQVIRELRDEELRLLIIRDADVKRRLVQTKMVLIAGTVFGILMATLAGWAVRRYDFAERQFSENVLREGEARFRTLANNISQMAWMAGENGRIFWFNDRWFNYSESSLEDMADWGWTKLCHPDHVQRVEATIGGCFSTGDCWEDTFPLRDRDGNYRWFLSRAIPIRDSEGKV
jgi:PAS domain S-box-containing protein